MINHSKIKEIPGEMLPKFTKSRISLAEGNENLFKNLPGECGHDEFGAFYFISDTLTDENGKEYQIRAFE